MPATPNPLASTRIAALVVAAGRGLRAGGDRPKQYRTVAGEPVLRMTLAALLAHPAVDSVIVVTAAGDEALYADAVGPLGDDRLLQPVPGAVTRQGSVLAGLRELARLGFGGSVLVHDAARPFLSQALLDRAVAAARQGHGAIPGLAVTDTIKRLGADGQVAETPPRDRLVAVQTPQVFPIGLLLAAHEAASAQGRDDFTDDAALMEWAGHKVHVFAGDPANRKLTHPEDFTMPPSPTLTTRVGTGYDVHAFADGDHVWIGGVRIAHECGVAAHSDGDVALHALTDALLGALADGDIGTHFPPSDPQWRGASSDRFLAFAVERVRRRGGRIDHLDLTLVCEAPKIGPHRDAIRERIAAIAGVPASAVGLKATTSERLGFTGRREGLAALATATIRLPEEP